MTLKCMRPDSRWQPNSAEQEAIETLRPRIDELSILVWGADWCGDCKAALPLFAAALERLNIDPEKVTQHEVQKLDDGSKAGPQVTEYDIKFIPTIVLERNGQEIARFVESGEDPAIVDLAIQIIDAAEVA